MLTHFSSFKLILLLIGVIFFCNTQAQVTKLKDIVGSGINGRKADDSFGYATDMSDDIIVVGAAYQDYDANGANELDDAGAVYIFYRNEGGKNNWGLKKKLISEGFNNRIKGDQFGFSVAIDNDIIVVGANRHDFDINGSDSINNTGAAYIFYRNEGGNDNWGFKKKLVGKGINSRHEGDFFGISVDISENTIIVGASRQDFDSIGMDSLADAGAAYIFNKNEGGKDNWGLKKKLTGSGTNGRKEGDFFGNSVAISNHVVAIGALFQNFDSNGDDSIKGAGAVYLYYKDEGGIDNWGLKKKLTASGLNNRELGDQFSRSIKLLNDLLVIGADGQSYDTVGNDYKLAAGAAYIFYKNEGGIDNWGQVKKLTGSGVNGRNQLDFFGFSVALSNDAIAVSAIEQRYDENGGNELYAAGATYLFFRNEGGIDNWGQKAKIVGSDSNGRSEADRFGFSVTISNNILVIGIPSNNYDTYGSNYQANSGKISIFLMDNNTSITKIQKDNEIAIGSEGKNIHISSTTNEDYTIIVYDLMGREIVQTNSNRNLSQTISLPNVATGYYLVKISQGYSQKAFKVYIQ